MKQSSAPKSLKLALGLSLLVVLTIWWISKDVRSSWYNVPPAPSAVGMTASVLGDSQFAYRQGGLALQTMGDGGGRIVPLQDYNYEHLRDWFFSLYALDPRSDFVPMLAAYYYGSTQRYADAKYLIDFLEVAGNSAYGEKWRWLVQAIYLARYRTENIPRALSIAKKLADLQAKNPEIPVWTLHMGPFILADQGDKQAATELMKVILGSTKNLHPNEINFMIDYIDRAEGK